jgi:hypothetical protein
MEWLLWQIIDALPETAIVFVLALLLLHYWINIVGEEDIRPVNLVLYAWHELITKHDFVTDDGGDWKMCKSCEKMQRTWRKNDNHKRQSRRV